MSFDNWLSKSDLINVFKRRFSPRLRDQTWRKVPTQAAEITHIPENNGSSNYCDERAHIFHAFFFFLKLNYTSSQNKSTSRHRIGTSSR
jgi:hypothetical protein